MLSVNFNYTAAALKAQWTYLAWYHWPLPSKALTKDVMPWFQARVPSSILEQTSDKQFDKPCNKYYPAAS